MRNFQLDDIAHAIINGRVGSIGVLKTMGLEIADNADEESVFRLVLEHREDSRLDDELARTLIANPYHRHCTHCIEAIHSVYKKGLEIQKSMTSNE